eukprot:TRINITY_DN36031_c0_g1_i2.p1 TRINITY_DN36031_c0_g1~~TRINITY_DN36031_c0_g1_i2.p1  ORF type:complete len:404 (-),score=104.75 TRINITY_DN36031_c0_g1_i2:44-1255(-)
MAKGSREVLEQPDGHRVNITVKAGLCLVDPRAVLSPLEEGEHPPPPAEESFKLVFTLPGMEEPLELQCGGDMVHEQQVNEGYIESLVNTPGEFKLVGEDNQEVGCYKISMASWAMGTPKVVREELVRIDCSTQEAEEALVAGQEEAVTEGFTEEAKQQKIEEMTAAVTALKAERVAILDPSNIDFTWEISEYELQVLLRCQCETNVARLPGCSALQKVSISLQLGDPMMSEELEMKLNPLAITLVEARNLPDKPLNFRQLMERCEDPYAEYEFLGKKVRTFPQKHQQHMHWNFTSVFFVGLEDQSELMRKLEAEPLRVYLHDRDPKELQLVTDEELREMGCYDWYYAKKAAKGCDPNAPCLLYTSDAADEEDSVDLGGRRIIKKKKKIKRRCCKHTLRYKTTQ